MDSTEFIELPSGRRAIGNRPSLKGLPKFSDIEKVRAENGGKREEATGWMTGSNVVKWSVGAMVIGAVGGLGYYFVDRIHRKGNGRHSHSMDGGGWSGLMEWLWTGSMAEYIYQIATNDNGDDRKSAD